ncbi:MAG: NAD(P)-binding domain-containing protein, partial [Thermodesulfobacteriota bacterium]
MTEQNPIICFLGSGNMAEAIIKGIIETETVPASRIIVTDSLNA